MWGEYERRVCVGRDTRAGGVDDEGAVMHVDAASGTRTAHRRSGEKEVPEGGECHTRASALGRAAPCGVAAGEAPRRPYQAVGSASIRAVQKPCPCRGDIFRSRVGADAGEGHLGA